MLRIACLFAAFFLAVAPGRAQDGYPSRQITLITLTAPGAALDALARILASGLQEQMGQPVVVLNRTGAGGNIGGAEIARAAPDGYTIGMTIVSTLAINPNLYQSMPFDPEKDYTLITMAADLNCLLNMRADFPVNSFKELVAWSKANPGKLSFGSAGVGTALHMTGEMLKMQSGLDMVHVPYVGVAKSLPDLISGQIQVLIANPSDVMNLIRDGRLKSLGVAARKRDATLPDVPTFAEQGYPDIISSTWFGVGGPAGIARPIVDRLNKEIHAAMKKPATAERLAQLGMNPILTTPEEFVEFARSERKRWEPIVKAAQVKVQ